MLRKIAKVHGHGAILQCRCDRGWGNAPQREVLVVLRGYELEIALELSFSAVWRSRAFFVWYSDAIAGTRMPI
jgi:hypothetical protein